MLASTCRGAMTFVLASMVAFAANCHKPLDWTDTDGSLHDAQKRYTQLIRWGEVELASSFVNEEQREDFLALSPVLQGVRFTDYEIGSIQYDEEAAVVWVEYQAYPETTMLSTPIKERQVWRRSRTLGSWEVEPDIASFLAALPAPR